MKILWLAPYTVWPLTHGGKIRTYNLAHSLAVRGHEVEVWCLTDEPQCPSAKPPGLTVKVFGQRGRNSLVTKLIALASPLPGDAWVLRAPAALAAIRSARGFDIAIVEQAQCGSIVPELEQAGLRWVLDAQNVEWWLTSQISKRLPNPVTKSRFALDALKFKRLETHLLSSAKAVIAVSDTDVERLHLLAPSISIDVRRNGVDTSYFQFVDHSKPGGSNLLMTGSLGYYPNLDASLWLLDEILPRVRTRLPDVRLELVGSGVTPEVESRNDPTSGIHIVGAVADVRPHLASADVFVMPIRLGSGTRLKALEALASGVPIVATRVAVEGLGLEDRDLVLLGETPDEFADSVHRALTDSKLRSRIAVEGRRYAVETFEWSRIAEEFEATLERAIR